MNFKFVLYFIACIGIIIVFVIIDFKKIFYIKII